MPAACLARTRSGAAPRPDVSASLAGRLSTAPGRTSARHEAASPEAAQPGLRTVPHKCCLQTASRRRLRLASANVLYISSSQPTRPSVPRPCVVPSVFLMPGTRDAAPDVRTRCPAPCPDVRRSAGLVTSVAPDASAGTTDLTWFSSPAVLYQGCSSGT
jgi:hypothetical protein